MPSKFSQTVLSLKLSGTLTFVRYHQSFLQRSSGMISGRLFSPYVGSGYTPLSTSVVRTVPGTVALYQPFASYPFSDSFSPSVVWQAELYLNQPSFFACASTTVAS